MPWLLLTPVSISALICLSLAAFIAFYLLRLPRKTPATWFLAAAFGMQTLTFSLYVLWGSIVGPGSPIDAMQLEPLARLSYSIFLALLVQFTYVFLDNPFPREARTVLLLSGVLVGTATLSLYGIISIFSFLYLISSLCVLLLALWALVLLVRKVVRFSRSNGSESGKEPSFWRCLIDPQGRAARAHRAFAFLFSLFLIDGVLMILAATFVISTDVLVASASLLYPFFLFGFITVYVNHAPEATTFQVRLVGLTLATTLTLLQLANVIVFANLERVDPYIGRPLSMPERQTLRFEPIADSGYEVTEVSFQIEVAHGRRLPLEVSRPGVRVGIDFSFPFSNEAWRELHVSATGHVAFGDATSERGGPFSFWISRRPGIALMATTPDRVDVYVRQDSGRAVVTWEMIPLEGPEKVNTAQLTLYESGAFTISYIYEGAYVVHRGVRPGGGNMSVQEMAFSGAVPFTVPPGTFLLEDTYLPNRRLIHERVRPLFWLILGSALFILTVFPLSFRAILTRPLERLLAGMRRIDQGEREVDVPMAINDEIGRLTGYFNQMTHSLREAEAELRAYAGQLEDRVAARTAELETSKEQLEAQARRLEELDALKSRFFANISHELRTPLALILGPLSDARERGDTERLMKQTPLMHRNAERLLALINQLLDLARLEAGSMQLHARRIDLARFLRELVLVFAGRAEREELRLLFDTKETEVWGYFDYDKLETIVANLLSNAIKFTNAGGKVRLELRRVDDGETAEILVEDTGVGMAEEELAHIFNRFYQVDGTPKRAHEGTGIGLALVKELVELQRGEIAVHSKRGFGTTFAIRLPLGREHLSPAEIEESDPPSTPDASTVEPSSKAGEFAEKSTSVEAIEHDEENEPHISVGDPAQPLVLIVEDNPDMRAYLRSLLEEDYRVLEAGDGAAGLDLAIEAEPDLVLSDLMMPVMDGYELCRAIRADAALGHVPVVLLTARADDESRLEGLGLGADDYLQKPFQGEELLLRVENLIAVRRRLRERFSRAMVVGPSEVVATSVDEQFLERVREVVESHLGDTNFGVDWLADEVGLSRRQLGRRLKAMSGLSPSGYLRMMRLERAAQLLARQAGSVQEIAYRVGFRDSEHFSKIFRQAFGVAPSGYPSDESGTPRAGT